MERNRIKQVDVVLYHGNVHTFHSLGLRDQCRLYSGPAQVRLSALIRNHQLNEGPEKTPPLARDPKYVTTMLFD